MAKIFALSVRQPWAQLILDGRKTIELRSWSADYRGLLWLHTGKKSDPILEAEFGYPDLFRGGYLGIVELTKVEQLHQDEWNGLRHRHLDPGSFEPGYFAWYLEHPHAFRVPILGGGSPGPYYPDDETEEMLAKALQTIA